MRTTDYLTFLIFADLVTRRIIPNRTTLKRWMERDVDPFPRPIVLAEGTQQSSSKRFSGRRVAWREADVEAWIERRAQAGSGSAA